MIQELKKYFNWKNPTFLFTVGLLAFMMISFIDLMIYETTPGLKTNYFLALLATFAVGKSYWIWNYYSKKVPNLNFLHVLITTAIIFLIIHPTSPWWIFGVAVLLALLFKSLFRYKGQPIFNPAALGIYMTYLVSIILTQVGMLEYPIIEGWWGADLLFTFADRMPVLWSVSIFFFGFFVFGATRFRKHPHATYFYLTYTAAFLLYSVFIQRHPLDPMSFLISIFTSSYVFLAYVMVAEPKTSPILPAHQLWLGIVGGILVLLFTIVLPNTIRGLDFLTLSTFPLLLLNLTTFFVKNQRSLFGGTPASSASLGATSPPASPSTELQKP